MNKIEIRNLTKTIRDRNETIDALEKQLLTKGNEWLCELRLQGAELIALKRKTPHGQWMKVVGECGLSIKTAERRMTIAANSSRVSNLSQAQSLRQALALCDAPVESTETEHQPQRWPGPIEAISRASKFIGYVERFPIAGWPQPQVVKLREDLLPVAKELWPDKF